MNQQPNPNLARILDEVQVKTNPLPTSFIADKVDNHIKTTYATLMASILLYKPVGETESRLFAMELTALGLDYDISKYFNLVKDLNTKQVLEFCQTLDAAEKQLTFLFDCLMLCRAGSPLNEQQIFLFNEFVNIWHLETKYIASLIFWVKIILGIDIDYDNLPSDLVALKIKVDDSKAIFGLEQLVEKNIFVTANLTKLAKLKDGFNHQNNSSLGSIIRAMHSNSGSQNSNNYVYPKKTGFFLNFQNEDYNWSYYIIALPSYLDKWTDLIRSLTLKNQ